MLYLMQALFAKKGAKRVLPLPVSAPFHTLLMRDAADKLSDVIKNIHFSAPKIPILHNVNANDGRLSEENKIFNG